MTQREKGERFRQLHEGEPFVIPNPWDAGSAKVFATLGFQALATTSGGFAFTLGRRDGHVTLDQVVEHTRALAEATDLPVSVDLENGHGPRAEDAARAIEQVAEAGAVGGSIEDFDPDGERIYEPSEAVERVTAAVEAVRGLDFAFMLTARAENHFRGNPDIDDTIARLQAFEQAGADVLYAPGLRTLDEIRAVCDATTKPVNVHSLPKLGFAEVTGAGAQRISVGASLAFVGGRRDGRGREGLTHRGDLRPNQIAAGLGQLLRRARLAGSFERVVLRLVHLRRDDLTVALLPFPATTPKSRDIFSVS